MKGLCCQGCGSQEDTEELVQIGKTHPGQDQTRKEKETLLGQFTKFEWSLD